MTTLLDKGISLIKYNYLNLPSLITQNSGNMTYTYRADGTKIKKVYGVKTTDYLDGFQYENTIPQFVPTAEGYYEFTTSRYVYNYKDHLGNIRLSYYRNGATAQVLEENNYYPFGLKHEGYNELNTGTAAYNYKYNGKELQETGMYDYGARMYMPDIGRWGVVDPLAEKMPSWSPYAYGFNNPIRMGDPTGMEPEDWVKRNGLWNWENNITSRDQALKSGAEDYADGKSNNTYTSISGSEVTLKQNNQWSEDFTNVNRARLGEAIANCAACQQIETFEKVAFIGIPLALATGGVGGFALSGEMTAGAIGGRLLTDAAIQTAANFTTNGGNLGNALGRVNLTQSALAGVGMNYVGNSILSVSTNISLQSQNSVFNGTRTGTEFATQSALGIAGGAAAKGISGSSVFKGTVIGSYMQTTTRFGQTAGSAVGTVLMNTPDYGASVIQNKFP